MTHHQTYSLSEPAGNLFLITRFLGRGTSFPHRLMAAIAPVLSETAYSDIRKELEDHDFIKRAAEPKCFAITRDGRDWLGYRKLNPDIWMGAMKGVQVTVEQSIADDDKSVVELMIIHAAALANSLYEQDKTFYIYFMGLSVQCQIHMGYLSEAQHKLEKLQRLAKEIKNDDLDAAD
jgi:hypothetical protein